MGKGRKFPRSKRNKANPENAEAKTEQVAGEAEKEVTELPIEPVKDAAVEVTALVVSDGPDKGTNDKEVKAKDDEGKGTKGKKAKPRRGKGKIVKDVSKPASASAKAVDVAGVIFMCNTATKKDCFKYRVFGLPEAKKSIVERVTKGIKLFLFDFDQRVLYGIYKASSPGGMNLEPDAFKDSDRKFPAQVRFRIHKDCLPIEENLFKLAIKDNYYGRNKFNCELNAEQVQKLMQLFRPLDERGLPKPKPGKDSKRELFGKSNVSRGPPKRGPPPRGSGPRYPREYAPLRPRERIPSDLELRRLEQSRNGIGAPQDLYALPQAIPNPDMGYLEAEALYRQRLQIRQMQEARIDALERRGYTLDPLMDASMRQTAIPSEISRKRALDDVYAEERALGLALPKRSLLQEDLYRDIEYQREIPASSYVDALHALPGTYESIASQQPWRYL